MDKSIINVMLVEDDPFWRTTLENDLNCETDIQVVAVAMSREEAVAAVKSVIIDVVLMDLNLTASNLDGLDASREILQTVKTPLKIIMFTSFRDKEAILDSFRSGAINYISKNNYQDIVRAIRDAYADRSNIHPDAAAELIKELRLSILTPMEREVFELKQLGLNKTQISEKLHKTVNTIKSQLRSIKDKLRM
jgi:two-component system, NarL family, response regulator DevR